ncbi:hypothetical protein RGQ29_014104 [Quercus rubra]|uniref:Phorbol-ester/DAG-type domain-containing protein n=1 Tax=Quercus rubra TaxID=3512 RepID=A0AAN7FTH7_QUERU|nr:hypothetical protein RGQ29_014104 [Quercus rubra]
MVLRHFSDDHPLIFRAVTGSGFACNGCGESIEGSRYSCRECNFDLHPSCAELPRELQHPIHSKHPLILHKAPPYDGQTCTCSLCNLPCKWFVYHCPLCKFDLHIKCVSQPLNFEVEVHEHQLILFKRLMSFICDFCGIEGKGLPYLCGECGFWVHKKCASLPRMVKRLRHRHPLNFTDSIKEDHSEHRLCQLCVKKVDTNYRVYYCSSCDYVAHLDCATDKNGMDENFMRESKGKEPAELTNMLKFEDLELDEFTNELSYSVQKTKAGEGEIKIPIEIKHFCHEHDLKLTDELENYKICNGCIRPIFSLFYSCTECNFFLHKSCVELPPKKRHPLHQHPLTLERPLLFSCDACRCVSNGFSYSCHKCYFKLDLTCSLISELDTLTHVGHKHPLIFSSAANDEECSVCNSKGRIFRCTKCEFTLDFGCATLPHTVKYKQHEHPFTLNYIAEDDSGEYYCDICEEERDHPKHWFYYCEECNYLAHPKCIFEEPLYHEWGDYRNIKFGSTYISNVHQHPLTLVQETKDGSHHCNKCGRLCLVIAYACATCNISFDWWCVR